MSEGAFPRSQRWRYWVKNKIPQVSEQVNEGYMPSRLQTLSQQLYQVERGSQESPSLAGAESLESKLRHAVDVGEAGWEFLWLQQEA